MMAGGGLELGSSRGKMGVEMVLVLIVLFVGVIAGVVLISQGQRRIPTQSAKHVRGRKVYGGTRQYLPLRVNQAGVMPIIFASSLLLVPMIIFGWLASKLANGGFLTAAHRCRPWRASSTAASRTFTTFCTLP